MVMHADAKVPAIVVHDLHVRRMRTPVLHGLSLAVPRGRIVGLLGPSGSGKTTLMRSIVGVQVVDSGTIEVLGRPAGSRELRRRVAYVTQQASVYDDLTVRQNLRYFARILGAAPSDVDRVIARTELGPYERRLAGSLSGGQRGRVSLAAALSYFGHPVRPALEGDLALPVGPPAGARSGSWVGLPTGERQTALADLVPVVHVPGPGLSGDPQVDGGVQQ